MSTFKAYSQYYNLLYKDKEYHLEVEYIEKLFRHLNKNVKTILDLGCGTGRHDIELIKKGFVVQGVDVSQDMLEEASKNAVLGKLKFSHGDIRNFTDGNKYDAVISLFHVMSYQTSNEDILDTMNTAYKHLEENGVFIFDFWYGPAVLHQLPEVRVKELEDEDINVTRIAQPFLYENDNIIDVKYKIIINDKKAMKCEILTETHKMRYLFRPEIYYYLQSAGFEVKGFYEFLTQENPSKNSWGACCLAVKSNKTKHVFPSSK